METMMDNLTAIFGAIATIMTAVATIIGIFWQKRGQQIKEAAEKIQKIEDVARTTTQGIEDISEDVRDTIELLKRGDYEAALKKIPDVKNIVKELAEEIGTGKVLNDFLVVRGLSSGKK